MQCVDRKRKASILKAGLCRAMAAAEAWKAYAPEGMPTDVSMLLSCSIDRKRARVLTR